MSETHDSNDARIDVVLRDAGARMRAATAVDHAPMIRPAGAAATTRRWIVPAAIVTASAAAIVGAIWFAGPADETVREIPADSGVATVPDSVPGVVPITSAATAPPSTAPADTAPSDTAPDDSIPADLEQPVVSVTESDFDGAGGTCLRFTAGSDSADGCFTHDQLASNPSWVIALADTAHEVTVNALDPTEYSTSPTGDICDHSPSSLTQGRWLLTSCSTDRSWYVAAPQSTEGESTTYVIPPRTGTPTTLEPIGSSLPDGFAAYRATIDVGEPALTCLVVASFPDPWREACGEWTAPTPLLVPIGGTVFVVEPAPGLTSVEVEDISQLSVPVAGCTAPVAEMAAAIPTTSVMIVGLICAGDSAMVVVPGVFLQPGPVDGSGYPLDRAADGSWSTLGGGTSFPCDFDPDPACAVFGAESDLMTVPLRIPPWGLIGAREHDLDPVEVTAELRGVTGGAQTADEIAASVIARYGSPGAGEGLDPVMDSRDAIGLVVVEIFPLDDSIGSERYAMWYRPTPDGGLVVYRAYRVTACSRGIAAPDLCV